MEGLIINGVEVKLPDKKNFDAERFSGYFYKEDSLYIDNSHPSHILYSNIYRGKKN